MQSESERGGKGDRGSSLLRLGFAVLLYAGLSLYRAHYGAKGRQGEWQRGRARAAQDQVRPRTPRKHTVIVSRTLPPRPLRSPYAAIEGILALWRRGAMRLTRPSTARRFVPFVVPRDRRLQTLAVFAWTTMLPMMLGFFFILWQVSSRSAAATPASPDPQPSDPSPLAPARKQLHPAPVALNHHLPRLGLLLRQGTLARRATAAVAPEESSLGLLCGLLPRQVGPQPLPPSESP